MKTNVEQMRSTRPALLQALIEELEKGRLLLFRLDDEVYVRTSDSTGSVGGHFRHNLNFVDAVLGGVDTGFIDYNKRVRDPRVETEREYAAAKFAEAITRLRDMPASAFLHEVLVASETDSALFHRSSISREIEFVHSHTVHHHALISEKLSTTNIETDGSFGVAPSTLEYWQSLAA